VRDLAVGKIGERMLADLLGTVFKVRPASGRSHDVEFELDEVWQRCEVKFDRMSNFTGNVALEWRNDRTGEPSGLLASVTSLWFVILADEIWGACTHRMRQVFHGGGHIRDVAAAGDGNARIRLFSKASILGPHMVEVGRLAPTDLRTAILTMLEPGHRPGSSIPLDGVTVGSILS